MRQMVRQYVEYASYQKFHRATNAFRAAYVPFEWVSMDHGWGVWFWSWKKGGE